MSEDVNYSDSRRLRANIRARIRDRASRGGSSSRSSGSDGGSSSGRDSGSDTGSDTGTAAVAGTVTDGNDVAASLGQPSGNVGTVSDDGNLDSGRSESRLDASRSNGSRRDRTSVSRDDTSRPQTVSKPLAVLSRSVDISSIIDGDTTNAKPRRKYTARKSSNSDIIIPLQILVDFLFSLPVYAGWGQHWELDAEDGKDLSICVRDVLDAFPSKSSKAFIKALEKYIPVMALGITGWQIIKPRIQETRRLKAERQEHGETEQTEETRTQSFVN